MVSFSAASGIEFLVRRRARFFRYNFAYSAFGLHVASIQFYREQGIARLGLWFRFLKGLVVLLFLM